MQGNTLTKFWNFSRMSIVPMLLTFKINKLLNYRLIVLPRREGLWANSSLLHCSGCIGLLFPCYLFGKNAEFLGSGSFLGSCMSYFVLWGLANTLCCLLTDGILLGFPGCFVACYACGYRRALRSKYNLQVWHERILLNIMS